MKTTIEITDSLLTEAKKLAAARATTLRAIVEEGLRKVIEEKPKKPFKLRDCSVGDPKRIQKLNWPEIWEDLYKGRGA